MGKKSDYLIYFTQIVVRNSNYLIYFTQFVVRKFFLGENSAHTDLTVKSQSREIIRSF